MRSETTGFEFLNPDLQKKATELLRRSEVMLLTLILATFGAFASDCVPVSLDLHRSNNHIVTCGG